MKKKIWLSSPHMGGQEMKYIQQAFNENWIAPLGPNVTGFEDDLVQFLDTDYQIAAVSSGTAALHLALLLLNIQQGDEVICQSLTFCGSANPITYVGAQPIFVDSEECTWNMCPNALEEAIQNRINSGKYPKAIVVVSLYGMPYQADTIREVADKYGIPIIEDAAEALGSKFQGQAMGTFGDLSILSFNGNKIITTSGGGALITKTLDQKNKALFLATQAKENTLHYEHQVIGYNYRMSNISAGIGRGQMEVLQNHIDLRRANHDFYSQILQSNIGIQLLKEPNNDFYSNHWLSAFVVNTSQTDKKLEDLKRLFIEENIESRPLWKPMHQQPVFKNNLSFLNGVSDRLFENGICLPSGSNLTEEDRDRIGSILQKWLQ